MNYLPAESKVHDHKGRKADERQRRRIARMIGLGAIATVALLVDFGTWTHSSRSAAAVGVLENAEERGAKCPDHDSEGRQGTPHHRAAR